MIQLSYPVKEEVKNMDAKRKGEIAYALVRYNLAKNPIRLNPNDVRREIGDIAKSTGIPLEELNQFGRELLQEFSNEAFA